MLRWREELESGQYHNQLLPLGFIKPEDQEPEIEGFEFYVDAFRELSTSRPTGLDLGAIPFTAIAEYSRIYELRDFDEFAYVIRSMDRVFLSMNQVKKKANPGTKKEGENAARKSNSNNNNKGRL